MSNEVDASVVQKVHTAASSEQLHNAVISLLDLRPELANTEPGKELLRLTQNSPAQAEEAVPSKEDERTALISQRTSAVATALSGGTALGLLVAAVVPGAPIIISLGAAVVGLFASRYAAKKIDQLAEKDR